MAAKLIAEFGCSPLTAELFERVIAVNPARAGPLCALFKQGIIPSHRDLEVLLDAHQGGESFYIYTGRGPSSGALHIGHLIPFLVAKSLQDIFECPVYIQLSTDEKFLRDKLTLEEVEAMAISNAADIMSLGFDPAKTIILSNFAAIGQLYPTVMNICRNVMSHVMAGLFGITPGDHAGSYYFPAVEAAPAFAPALAGIIQSETRKRCLVVLGLDQDPYFRMARDIAHRLGCTKPALLHNTFIPGLKSVTSKMSASDPLTAIFLDDSDTCIKRKINKYAMSGGRDTAVQHRQLGADITVDVAYRYLQIFGPLAGTAEVETVLAAYQRGELLSGEFKAIVITALQKLLTSYRSQRLSPAELQEVMTIRRLE